MEIARDRVRFLTLLAGNLVAVALLAVVFCAQFRGLAPLWLLQAPYFAVGAAITLALTPLELLLLRRIRRRAPNAFIEALLAAITSTLVGIPGGLLIGLIGALGPRSFVGQDLNGLGTYIIVGGFMAAAACFICVLLGRLVAAFLGRVRWLAFVVLTLGVCRSRASPAPTVRLSLSRHACYVAYSTSNDQPAARCFAVPWIPIGSSSRVNRTDSSCPRSTMWR
ncbi:MAG: hypothetical protein DI534_14375 [Leifsonia xyli]|nr:MAG: hypothetical protein DI534_14375 [Leifsonia xyli]